MNGLRAVNGDPAAPPYSRGPYVWNQHVTFTAGVSGANTPGNVWYVDGENGNDSNNGKSWTGAFATIQAAVDASGDMTADVIYVAPSKYTENVIVEGHEGLSIIAVVPGWTTRVRASDATVKYAGTAPVAAGYCFLLLDRNITLDGFCCDADGGYGGVYVGDGGEITAVGGLPASTSDNSANCVVRNCLIRAGTSGVTLHGCSDNVVLENNVFSELAGCGVDIQAGTGRTNQRPIIRYNVFYAGASSTYGIDEDNSATNVGTLVHGNVFADRGGTFTYSCRFQAAGVHFFTGNYDASANGAIGPATSFMSGNFEVHAMNAPVYVAEA